MTVAVERLDISKKTVVDWYSMLRKVANFKIMNENDGLIGGEGRTVEIDKSLIAKRKYQRGRVLVGPRWIFGGIEREYGKLFIEHVLTRNAETLLEVIRPKNPAGN